MYENEPYSPSKNCHGQDYRDVLWEIMDEYKRGEGLIERVFYKRTGLKRSTVACLVHKHRHCSVDYLESLLDKLGFDLAFIKRPETEDDDDT